MFPLLLEIATSLHLTKSNAWLTNIYSMVGGIPMGLVLGLVCDQYGTCHMAYAIKEACRK
jgi:hypothetical protein